MQKTLPKPVGVGALDDPLTAQRLHRSVYTAVFTTPHTQELPTDKPNSKDFKFYFSIYNTIVFAGEKPSQSSHKFVLLRFGGENHLKAAIALLVNKQSFSPPNPLTPWLGALQKIF